MANNQMTLDVDRLIELAGQCEANMVACISTALQMPQGPRRTNNREAAAHYAAVAAAIRAMSAAEQKDATPNERS